MEGRMGVGRRQLEGINKRYKCGRADGDGWVGIDMWKGDMEIDGRV